jgi:hypothetical protein
MTTTDKVLIVAHRTAATPALLDAVRDRAAQSPATFTLLVPKPVHGLDRLADPEDVSDTEAQGVIGVSDPLACVEDAVNRERYSEIIVSTLPARVSRWLHLDLPRKVAGLGVPVTTVTAVGRAPVNV